MFQDGWRVIAGTSSGELLVYSSDRSVVTSFDKANSHTGAVLSLAEGGGNLCNFLVSGGKDG